MKAIAVFPEDRAVRVIDCPEPERLGPTDVKLAILDVGVCGTDREIARFEYGTPPAGSPYLIIGHESLGQVIEIGTAVSKVRPGDLVVTMVRRPCGLPECRACAVGRPDFCVTRHFTERGIKQRHGFMTEKVVDNESYMVVLPKELREVGVLLEPLTIAEKALIEVGDIQDRLPWLRPGDHASATEGVRRAVVLGAGPVGMLGTLALLLRGFRTWVYSLEPAGSLKARWVESVGARYLPAAEVPIARLPEVAGNVDLVYEATGASKIAFAALPFLGVNGVFILTGVPGRKGPIEMDADLIMRNLVLNNQLVYGTVNAGPDAFQAGVTDLVAFHRRWPEQLAQLITARHPAENAPGLLLRPPPGIKQVVSFAEQT